MFCQIHLYSDGGLDISSDGQFFFSCAVIATKPAPTPPSTVLASTHQTQPEFSSVHPTFADDESVSGSSSCSEFTTETENDSDCISLCDSCGEVCVEDMENSLRDMTLKDDSGSKSTCSGPKVSMRRNNVYRPHSTTTTTTTTDPKRLHDLLMSRRNLIPLPRVSRAQLKSTEGVSDWSLPVLCYCNTFVQS